MNRTTLIMNSLDGGTALEQSLETPVVPGQLLSKDSIQQQVPVKIENIGEGRVPWTSATSKKDFDDFC